MFSHASILCSIWIYLEKQVSVICNYKTLFGVLVPISDCGLRHFYLIFYWVSSDT